MPKYIRWREQGGMFFFSVVTHERRPFLTTPLARQCLRRAWKEMRTRYPFELVAFCLLPDHFHCLWRLPEKDTDYSNRMRYFKARFSLWYRREGGEEGLRSVSRLRAGERAFWHRRYWEHYIRDDDDLNKHFEYIHYNPVKHGLVKWPEEWPWSTFHRYIKLGWYEKAWGHLPLDSITLDEMQGE